MVWRVVSVKVGIGRQWVVKVSFAEVVGGGREGEERRQEVGEFRSTRASAPGCEPERGQRVTRRGDAFLGFSRNVLVGEVRSNGGGAWIGKKVGGQKPRRRPPKLRRHPSVSLGGVTLLVSVHHLAPPLNSPTTHQPTTQALRYNVKMTSPDQSPPPHDSASYVTNDQTPKPHRPYDYKSSDLESDRKAALEVEKRLLETRRVKKERAKAESDDREHEAAKLVQGAYRCVISFNICSEIMEDWERDGRLMLGSGRSHSARRSAKGMNLSSSDRWSDGLRQQRMSAAGKEQDEGKNDARTFRFSRESLPALRGVELAIGLDRTTVSAASRWKRGGLYAEKISEGTDGSTGTDAAEMTTEEEMDTLAKVSRSALAHYGASTGTWGKKGLLLIFRGWWWLERQGEEADC